VRLLAVEGCAKFGSLLDHEDCVAYVLPIVQKFAMDKSWRVRYVVAQQLYELCEAVGPELSRTELVPAYVKLLKVIPDPHSPLPRAALSPLCECRVLLGRSGGAIEHQIAR
jgi:hypothetical protein